MRGAVELLFTSGFSTAETTSDISGRGVGMDAVREKIRQLGGEVVIDSTPGEGTNAQIRLPLTLAIVSALQVDVSGAAVRDPARPDRAHPAPVRADRPLGRRQADAGARGRRPAAARRGRGVRPRDRRRARVRRDHSRPGRVAWPWPWTTWSASASWSPGRSRQIVSDGEPVSGGAALADGRIALIVDCDALAAENGTSRGFATTDPGRPAASPAPSASLPRTTTNQIEYRSPNQ